MAMEKWLPILTPDGRVLTGYTISDKGRVRSYWVKGGPRPSLGPKPTLRKASQRRVKGKKSKWLVMCLRVSHGEFYTYLVHELVAWSFLGPRPGPNHVIIHVNHRFDDNRASNLRWVTRSEASLHAVAFKPRRPLAKLTPTQVRTIRASKQPAAALADLFGVEKKAIYNVKWRKTWRDVPDCRW